MTMKSGLHALQTLFLPKLVSYGGFPTEICRHAWQLIDDNAAECAHVRVEVCSSIAFH